MKAYIEPEEITLMEQAASNLRDKILIHLLFRLGCRISEALALKVEDIDFVQGAVTIIHLKRRVKLSWLHEHNTPILPFSLKVQTGRLT
jgi:integrase/recombinase XerD